MTPTQHAIRAWESSEKRLEHVLDKARYVSMAVNGIDRHVFVIDHYSPQITPIRFIHSLYLQELGLKGFS